MEDLKDCTMEEKRDGIRIHFQLLKDMLISTGLIVAFDKTNNRFLFMDRDIYLKEHRSEGFAIDFKELSY